MLVEVEQKGIGCCCLILYIKVLAEYTKSERAKIVGREGVVGENKISSSSSLRRRRRRRWRELLSLVAVILGILRRLTPLQAQKRGLRLLI